MADLKLSEVYKIAQENNVGVKSLVGATWGLVTQPIVSGAKRAAKVPQKLADTISSAIKPYDDNIVVPTNTKTLLGDDFTSLYENYETKSYIDTNGMALDAIKPKSSYSVEMVSPNVTSFNLKSYSALTTGQKASYEIVLLSKKYASEYVEGATVANDKLADEYADKMARYRQYCTEVGASWDDVLSRASAELQTESSVYADNSKKLIGASKADTDRIIANRAHGMLVSCAGDGYTDSLLPSLAGKLSYEDTLDTSSKNVSFFKNITQWFKDKWESFKEKIPHPWSSAKKAVGDYVNKMETYIDNTKSPSTSANKSDSENVRGNESVLSVSYAGVDSAEMEI